MTGITVRKIQITDKSTWLNLWQGYLAFYQVSDLAESVIETTWRRLMADETVKGFVAVNSDNQVIGFAHIVVHLNTWNIAAMCYLEDLFVSETARGQGAGRALIQAVYDFAESYPCARVYWLTQESNKQAQSLYNQVATKTDFILYRKGFSAL